MSAWSVYASCSLCNARTKYHRHDDLDVARRACDDEALFLGWRSLPAAPERRRSAGWLCRECHGEFAEEANAAEVRRAAHALVDSFECADEWTRDRAIALRKALGGAS